MTVQLRQSTVIFLISIKIGMPERSLKMPEISFIVRHPFTMYGETSRAAVIEIKS